MGVVRVEVEGLQRLGHQCEDLAAELAGVAAPAVPGASFQATVGAVQAVNGSVSAASTALAARMAATSTKLVVGAAEYAGQDKNSATAIDAVSPTFLV